ncbi:MAG: hypothetical protein HRU26_07475 [Psychroserpens sp.]|nr:hypothetical protein [Psychroserpens sp.]
MSDEVVSAPEQVEEQVISEVVEQSQEIQEPVEVQEEVQAESESELKEEIEQAIEEGASEEEVVQMVKQFQLKVNGKEFVKELDLNDEEAVKKELQMAAMAPKAMQEAAEIRKALEQELTRLKERPWEVLKEMGHDERALVEDKIQELIKQDQKTPEQVAEEELRAELAEAREKAAKLEKQAQEREEQALYEQESQKLKDEIKGALDAHTSLHASPSITRKVAETMEWAMNNGFEDVTAEDVLPTVEKQLAEEMASMFEGFDDKTIEKYVGKSNLDKLRQKRVEEATKAPTSLASLKKESAPAKKPEEIKKVKQKLDDFMRRR